MHSAKGSRKGLGRISYKNTRSSGQASGLRGKGGEREDIPIRTVHKHSEHSADERGKFVFGGGRITVLEFFLYGVRLYHRDLWNWRCGLTRIELYRCPLLYYGVFIMKPGYKGPVDKGNLSTFDTLDGDLSPVMTPKFHHCKGMTSPPPINATWYSRSNATPSSSIDIPCFPFQSMHGWLAVDGD